MAKERHDAQVFEKLTPEEKNALSHNNILIDLYNEQVVQPMKEVLSTFPSRDKIINEIEGREAGYR